MEADAQDYIYEVGTRITYKLDYTSYGSSVSEVLE
jgi:hypothetical protein